MGWGGEAGHVHPDFGDDRLGGALTDAQDCFEPVSLRRERGDDHLDAGVEPGDPMRSASPQVRTLEPRVRTFPPMGSSLTDCCGRPDGRA